MTYFHPSGTLADDRNDVIFAPNGTSWLYTGLEVLTLAPGQSVTVEQGERESIVVPLAGSVSVSVSATTDAGATEYRLAGRDSPWGVTDVLYLPVHTRATITGAAGARIALPWAVATEAHPVQYLAADAVSSELRGAGICSRQVNNFGTPAALQTDRLIACEVMQPGGNWSSYPPHKHDVDGEAETQLEEIYYYEVAPSPAGTDGFALQRVYGSVAGDIDVTEEVRTGDVVTIPFGYHGPTVAAPGHDLYYLNVMAGPRTALHPDREWLISDDADHAWIRGQWEHEAVDPRLPFG
ncbi:5-deoxy-glucuronate isomerase [Glaciibacter superstes]|uniref:5-deoxy-glucuronate isomerase n=1 Tax=Glaciibacter superstes TaxID=501023 RepID=UPI0003B46512|nr:5-deoxy-glucuronate isomerase [Glaciibacter superstes]